MKINEAGLELLKRFEGCRLKSYQDVIGVWTIGYGSSGPDIGPGMVWTQEEADNRLARDLERFERGVEALLTAPVTSGQFSALVCFAYNVGLHNLETSQLLLLTNEGDMMGAAKQFIRWNHAGGAVVAGLTKRRIAEAALYLT